jgi:hypothetical protein
MQRRENGRKRNKAEEIASALLRTRDSFRVSQTVDEDTV